jgi:hypothetical protein
MEKMDAAFDKLVRELDDQALAGLGKALTRETSERRLHTPVQMEDIHPRMPEEMKKQALAEIARVLRGEE